MPQVIPKPTILASQDMADEKGEEVKIASVIEPSQTASVYPPMTQLLEHAINLFKRILSFLRTMVNL